MKKKIRYNVNEKVVESEIQYIPVRYILAIFITVLEIAAIIGIVVALCYYVPYFYVLAFLTEIACVIRIIASDDNPEYKIPWLLFVLILPIAGFMLYFLFYSRKLKKKYIKRLHDIKNSAYKKDDSMLLEAFSSEDPSAASQARMLCKVSESHLFRCEGEMYFPLGEDMLDRILVDLESAEKFIFMEYFIIEEGKMWNSILDVLKRKAKAGVEVRVVYDDMGCMTTLPGDYAKTLAEFGISATPFSRLKGAADNEFNNRSHRKITVIDGKIGYTGGVNLADEYINEIVKHGHWKDTAIRIEGEAVNELTRLFLIDYGINVKNLPTDKYDYFPLAKTAKTAEESLHLPSNDNAGYIIPFGDGPRPIFDRRVAKSAIQNMLAGAERCVYMTTPYLIMDNDLCQSIENAALRGVDIKIITPYVPDKRIVQAMSRSYYHRLSNAGVEIYEYKPGFIHAKSYVADGKIAVIGTINLDYRSLVHNFENGIWLYNSPAVADLERDIKDTLKKSIRFIREPNIIDRFITSVVRIFAPLL